MKKQSRKIISRKYSDCDEIHLNDQLLETLANAWDNLPVDMSLDEREVFFEIAQNLVRFHQMVKRQVLAIENLEKN